MNKAVLTARLREGRKRRGLTQEQAAELIGVSAWTYKRWEKGDRTPGSEEAWRRVVAFCGCTLSDLIGEEVRGWGLDRHRPATAANADA